MKRKSKVYHWPNDHPRNVIQSKDFQWCFLHKIHFYASTTCAASIYATRTQEMSNQNLLRGLPRFTTFFFQNNAELIISPHHKYSYRLIIHHDQIDVDKRLCVRNKGKKDGKIHSRVGNGKKMIQDWDIGIKVYMHYLFFRFSKGACSHYRIPILIQTLQLFLHPTRDRFGHALHLHVTMILGPEHKSKPVKGWNYECYLSKCYSVRAFSRSMDTDVLTICGSRIWPLIRHIRFDNIRWAWWCRLG